MDERALTRGGLALSAAARSACAIVVCFPALGAARRSPAPKPELPPTPAGRCAAAYFEAFNTGDSEAMQAFNEKHYALSYLRAHPREQRSTSYRRLYGIFGALSPLRLALGRDLQLTLLADAAKTDNVLVMRFQLEKEPPHRLSHVTFSGIDHAEVSDEDVAHVATRAAPVDAALREATVQSVAKALREGYVLPDVGRRMGDSLLQHHAEGRYDDAAKAGALADKLTEDAIAVSGDKHVWVEAQNPFLQESSDHVSRSDEELRRGNHGFTKVEVLPGNIGYVKYDMVLDGEEALTAAAAALESVARCDALVFDIRDNVGGGWGTASLILGYLLPPGKVFGYMYDRDGRRVEERAVPRTIPGRAFDPGVPVYILTSGRTGSAAEGFAYTLRSFGRATTVGEVTLGMAHPSKEVALNEYFRMSIPYLRSENVVTGTDFEGTGVEPQIRVEAERALEAALEDVRRRIGGRG